MSSNKESMVAFLEKLMQRYNRLPSQLAADLGVSHTTVNRWVCGTHIPSIKCCYKLAEYSGTSLQNILSTAGHIPHIAEGEPSVWPSFREYAHYKYHDELDEDIITMIENLIDIQRKKRVKRKERY